MTLRMAMAILWSLQLEFTNDQLFKLLPLWFLSQYVDPELRHTFINIINTISNATCPGHYALTENFVS